MKKIILLNNIARDILIFRRHLIKFLIAHNYTVYAMATDFTSDTKEKVEELGAIPIAYSFARTGLNPLADIKNMKYLEKLFREIAPDIILSSFAKPVIFGTLAAKRAGVPKIIAMVEGLGYAFTQQPKGQSIKAKMIKYAQVLLYKIALPKADCVLFLNQDDPKDLLDRYFIKVKKREVLGGIGLDLNEYQFSQVITTSISFVFIARLLREKGIFEFLKAAEQVKKKYPAVVFKVIGSFDTENPGALKRRELQYYIENNIIEYPGFVTNIKDWIKESSVFVLPSYREGVPRSTQEAMAMGRAVITTDVPGCRETVVEGKNGFLIPKWDVVALAKAMEYFIENPEEIIRMGEESHKIALEKFDGEKVNQRLLKIIEA